MPGDVGARTRQVASGCRSAARTTLAVLAGTAVPRTEAVNGLSPGRCRVIVIPNRRPGSGTDIR